MDGEGATHRASQATSIVAGVALVVAAYFGRGFLVPVAIGCLLAALLSPVAARLERWSLHRALAAFLCVLLLTAAIVGLGTLVARQVVDLSARLPDYRATIQAKLTALQSATRQGPLKQAREGLERMEEELRTPPERPPAREPVAVQVVPPETTFLEALAQAFGPVFELLVALSIVLLLTGFLIASRSDLRDRFVRWMSLNRMVVTTEALVDASRRVSRYLGGLFIVNTIYGTAIALALLLLDLPNAPLWGLLAGLLRFVPFVGTWIGLALPVLLSVAVFEAWSRTLAVAGSIAAINFVTANLLEPVMLGRRTGIPAVAVVVAAVFWTWLWGIPGLLLAVPMTVCFSVMGRYVPALRWLDVLVGRGPGLSPTDRVYQRLLALDTDGARRILEADVRAQDLGHAYDEVLLPALGLASADWHRGEIDEERAATLVEAVQALADAAAARAGLPEATRDDGRRPVWLVPADGAPAALACAMLERLLAQHGIGCRRLSGEETSGEIVEEMVAARPRIACVAGLPPFTLARVRYLCRRICQGTEGVCVVAAVWDPTADHAYVEKALREAGASAVFFRLTEAAEALSALAAPEARGPSAVEPTEGVARPAG
jgi:predicted PurR-regulated permease PerM